MFSFFMPEADCEKNRQAVIDRLGQLLEIARDTGIRLCHENEKGIYGATAQRCLDLHRALPELKGVFDPANFVQCGQETLSAWELLHPYVDYMHIKDALPSGLVVPAGKGHGNVAAIVAKYAAQGGKVLSLEPHLTKFVGLNNLEAEEVSEIGALHFENGDEAFDYAANTLYGLVERL
jgi:sugar phosphate isomerase/epimerase